VNGDVFVNGFVPPNTGVAPNRGDAPIARVLLGSRETATGSDRVGVDDDLSPDVGLKRSLGVPVGVWLRVGDGLLLIVGLGVLLTVGLGVWLIVGLGVSLRVGLGVWLRVGLGVWLGVLLRVGVGLRERVGLHRFACVYTWLSQPLSPQQRGLSFPVFITPCVRPLYEHSSFIRM
jgi:hypothetical protein